MPNGFTRYTARSFAFGPNDLSFVNADAGKDIYGHRPGHPEMEKTKSFTLLGPRYLATYSLLMKLTTLDFVVFYHAHSPKKRFGTKNRLSERMSIF
jgi:hypothetical protein